MLSRRIHTSFLLLAFLVPGLCPIAQAESHRDWKPATLVAAERRDDAPEMEKKKTTKTTTDIFGDDQTTSTTTVAPSGLQRLWMYYTIQSSKTVYVARIGVNLPWTKRITAEPGNTVKYAVDGKKIYVLNEDGTEAKAEIMATRMVPPPAPEKRPE